MYTNGTLARVTALLATLTLATTVFGQTYDLSWHTIDGGGAMFTAGGQFTLSGTIGQPDAGGMSGGNFTLIGGFWPGATGEVRGDMNCDGLINNFDIDAFVLALTSPAGYAATYPNCDIHNGDINQDGLVNNFDIDGFVACITSGCP